MWLSWSENASAPGAGDTEREELAAFVTLRQDSYAMGGQAKPTGASAAGTGASAAGTGAFVAGMGAFTVVALLALMPGCSAPASTGAQQPADIQGFLSRYFSTWSEGDMDGYESMFFPRARVAYLDGAEIKWSMSLGPFIDSQRRVHEQAKVRPLERLVGFSADKDEESASVTARWELTSGRGITTGTDRFILAKDFNGDWRIVSLVFYNQEVKPSPARQN